MLKIFISDNSIVINVQDPIEGRNLVVFPKEGRSISDRVILQILRAVEVQSSYYYYLRKELKLRIFSSSTQIIVAIY